MTNPMLAGVLAQAERHARLLAQIAAWSTEGEHWPGPHALSKKHIRAILESS
jgi:hypothetical protein